MTILRTLVTQSAADTTTTTEVSTGLTVDGKAGWQIGFIRAFWTDGAAVAADDYTLYASLGTVTGAIAYTEEDNIAQVGWGMQNTAGVAVAVTYEPFKEYVLVEPRLTVQPTLFLTVQSANTSQANDVIIEFNYEVVKLSDNELFRLWAGGA
jgi:hypothetical protein